MLYSVEQAFVGKDEIAWKAKGVVPQGNLQIPTVHRDVSGETD